LVESLSLDIHATRLCLRYYEVVEVYRRMLFASALPVLAPQGLKRAALGCVLAILAVARRSFRLRATQPR
jgi:hypothetical protein